MREKRLIDSKNALATATPFGSAKSISKQQHHQQQPKVDLVGGSRCLLDDDNYGTMIQRSGSTSMIVTENTCVLSLTVRSGGLRLGGTVCLYEKLRLPLVGIG